MAQPPQAQAAVFQLALSKFKASLSAKERKQFGATSLHDLHVAIESLQQKQKSEGKLRAMSKLGRFLEGMQEYDKLVAVFLNTSEILAFVWGPMKFILQVASTFYVAFDTLLEAYRRIGEHIYMLKQYEAYSQQRTGMCHPLTLIYEDLLEFHMKAMRFFIKPMWKQLFQALWKTFEFEFGGLLRNMEAHMSMVRDQVSIAQFAEMTDTQHLMKQNIKQQKETETQRRRDFVQQWLSPANCEADFETFSKVYRSYPTTGKWIFQNNRFDSWFNHLYCSTHLLWVNGVPGAGKTILATSIIEAARKCSDVVVVFFYCRHKDCDRNSFLSVARGLLSQMLVQDDDLLTYIYDIASTSGQTTLSTNDMARDLLTTSLKNFKKLYVVVDGLDECDRDERKDIASFFKDTWNSLAQKDKDTLRCLFLSQDDNIARKDHGDMSCLKITESHIKNDIRAYAEARSLEIKEKFDLTTDRQIYIASKVTDAAEGMFLFAHLMASYLYDQNSVRDLENELDLVRIPEGPLRLNELYSRIIQRLSENRGSLHADSIKVLTWTVCAKRPLKWREIQCLQSIDIENQCVDWNQRKFRVNSRELCGSLVEIHVDGTLVFIHRTAKVYLTETTFVNVVAGELAMATMCISYLGFPGFDPEVETSSMDAFIRSGYYTFAEYAYAYWSSHLDASLRAGATKEHLRETCEAIEGFLVLQGISSENKTTVPRSFFERWKELQLDQDHDKFVLAGYLSQKQLVASTMKDSEDPVLALQGIIERFRTRLEILWPTMPTIITPLYGQEVFKCPRVNCVRFYNGFSSKQARDDHFLKHDRSYFCSFPGCHMSTFGCATLKELHKHETEYHNALDMDEDEPEYPEMPIMKVSYNCKQCDKTFTRNNNLKIHMRRAHGGPNEEKFYCTHCGQSFARLGDRTRHEGTIHTGSKEVSCSGTLKSGNTWGCGRKFNRGDMLNRHWMSTKGKLCIAPKQQEEAAESGEISNSTGTS